MALTGPYPLTLLAVLLCCIVLDPRSLFDPFAARFAPRCCCCLASLAVSFIGLFGDRSLPVLWTPGVVAARHCSALFWALRGLYRAVAVAWRRWLSRLSDCSATGLCRFFGRLVLLLLATVLRS